MQNAYAGIVGEILVHYDISDGESCYQTFTYLEKGTFFFEKIPYITLTRLRKPQYQQCKEQNMFY